MSQNKSLNVKTLVVPRQQPRYSLTVVGLGYVGAVLSAAMARLGHRVVGVDLDARKRDLIASGESPIHEYGLSKALNEGVEAGRLRTSGRLAASVAKSDVTFVCVGTPTAPDGSCDDRFIRAAAREIGEGLKAREAYHLVLLRCSVPPGTTMKVMVPEIEAASGKKLGQDFGVGFSPEFLREGVALDDFMNPPKTLIGASDDRAREVMVALNEGIDENPIYCAIEEAEMVKYVDNVWHATKVCFGNEVGRLSKSYGIDGHAVMDAFCQDTKLNLSPYYLKPGFAYGGSCLPKEVRAVTHLAKAQGVDLPLIQSLTQSNQAHIDRAVRMIEKTGARRVGILGLAFKPGTDDLRESPILEVIAALVDKGIEVTAFDEALSPSTPIEGQIAYVKHASPGLKALAPKLKSMLAPSATLVATTCQTLVLNHRRDVYASAAGISGANHIIDLAGFANGRGYEGIGW